MWLNMRGCCGGDSNSAKVAPEMGEDDETLSNESPTAYDDIVTKNRKKTDSIFLIAFCLFIVALFGLMAYCMSDGNIYRILNGYNNCGNVCGRNNEFAEVNNSGCHGMDMTKHKYLRVQSWNSDSVDTDYTIQINRICVENCSNYSGYQTVLNRCIPENKPQPQQEDSHVSKSGLRDFFQEVAEDLYTSWKEILYMCAIAFVFSIITLVMFKFLAGVIIWVVLIGAIIAFISATTLLWIHYNFEVHESPNDVIGKRRTRTYLILAIISTVITVLLIVMVIFMRKRIKLVIVLFEEAGKAAASMPLLLFEPILTFIAISVVICLWIYFAVWIESSGRLTIQNNTSAQFIKDDAMKVTRWYNLMAMFWKVQFLIGCQHMAIAGAVSIWYFTRNKSELNAPIRTSFDNLIRYHLGTVAIGSLFIAIIQMLRVLLKVVENYTRTDGDQSNRCCASACQCCLGSCQSCLQYINRNAYIETAIYGDSFFVAGSKAYHKLMSNSLRVFTINTIGDFVLFLGKVFVIAITVLCGIELLRPKTDIHHVWIPLVLAGIFAYLISHCFITVYEMIIDTIFLCFCEDCELNDGLSRPYFMHTSLMDFVQNSKKIMGIKD